MLGLEMERVWRGTVPCPYFTRTTMRAMPPGICASLRPGPTSRKGKYSSDNSPPSTLPARTMSCLPAMSRESMVTTSPVAVSMTMS